eukprot:14730019-Alexandrium_andersonii.AAC.1
MGRQAVWWRPEVLRYVAPADVQLVADPGVDHAGVPVRVGVARPDVGRVAGAQDPNAHGVEDDFRVPDWVDLL